MFDVHFGGEYTIGRMINHQQVIIEFVNDWLKCVELVKQSIQILYC